MDKLRIRGGARIQGTVSISGAKNAALPAMAATLLTPEVVHLQNMPIVNDILTTQKLLCELGAKIEILPDHSAKLQTEAIGCCEAPYNLVKTMRASVLVLGPLLARKGEARVSLPGGCAIGARPINLHLKGFQKLGAEVRTTHGYIEAKTNGLKGADVLFDRITVTGTENLMMAATLASGHTTLRNAAREPEVTDLAELLNSMGGRIKGAGTSTIHIEGVSELHGTTHRVIPDRIEAGTFLLIGAITNGTLTLENVDSFALEGTIRKLRQTGVQIDSTAHSLRVSGTKNLTAVNVETEEYPGFATDMQAQYMAFMTQVRGTSVISENIFENRFMHASELIRMGADIEMQGSRAFVKGKTPLSGTHVIASDLRASASLVLAGLVAEGETIIDRVYHLDRGYERIEEKLRRVGANIERLK